MPIMQADIYKDRSREQENQLVEALTDTMMSKTGTNRKATWAVLCDTDTEDRDVCGKLNLNTFPG